MKALVGAFNQEKALVGAFSVIVQPVVEPMDRLTALIKMVSDNVTMDTVTQDNTPGPRSESCHGVNTDMGLHHASATFALSTK